LRRLIPTPINSLSILLVKTAYFFIKNFINKTDACVNLRLEWNCFPAKI
jgi:hypothetical protein